METDNEYWEACGSTWSKEGKAFRTRFLPFLFFQLPWEALGGFLAHCLSLYYSRQLLDESKAHLG